VPDGWTVTRNDVAPIHTFTAPEDGWLVNSHVIEFPSQLFVIDAQYTLPHAREVVGYAQDLRKPITRLIATHYHPDHILGAAAFDVPLYALESVAEKIGAVGDRVAQEERQRSAMISRRPRGVPMSALSKAPRSWMASDLSFNVLKEPRQKTR
jgi:glyoxylase-like metal-dependent hydrolase (beta-lactamase superfamily II)